MFIGISRLFFRRGSDLTLTNGNSYGRRDGLFSPRMSGLDLVTLCSIRYSYYYDIRLRPYAYAFAFGHRLLGYIRLLGLPCFKDEAENSHKYECPLGCKHSGYDGGKHAISCKRSGNHLIGHTSAEKLSEDGT